MTRAYVDASCLVAIALGEAQATALARRLVRYDELLASNLLEAELRATLSRERVDLDADLLTWLDWVFPDRPLTAEISRVLSAGYLRGADAWHVACALFMADDPRELAFLTLDERQRAVAAERRGLDDRIRELEERGVIVRSPGRRGKLRPIARRPGALERFLRERDE